MTQDLRVAFWLGAACCLLYVLLGHGHFKSSDEISVYEATESLWERGDLEVGPGPHVFEGRGGRRHNHFAVGQSALALPFYGLGRGLESVLPETWSGALGGPRRAPKGRSGGRVEIWAVMLYPAVITGLLVAVFFLFERRLGASPAAAALGAAVLGGGTYLVNQSAYFLRHSTEALTLLGALFGFCAYRRSGSLISLALGSSVACLTLLVRVPAAIAAPGLAGYLAWALLQRSRAGDGARRLLAAVAVVALPLVVTVGIHAWINQLKWGSWWSSPMTGQIVYFDTPLHVGLHGLLLSPGASILVYSPPLLLSPWLLRLLWRTHRAECAAALAISASFLLVAAGFWSWSGLWAAPGPRYLFCATPLLLLPLGLWLDSGSRVRWWLALGLGLLGLGVQLAVTSSSWNTVVDLNEWRSWEPGMEFLFLPSQSPVLGGARALGEGYVDSWLWWIGQGWRAIPPRPGVAALIALGVVSLLAICVWRAAVAVRAHSWGRMDAPGTPPVPGAEPA